MSTILRQSTQIKIRIGPAVAVGDGFTPVTTLDLSTADEAELLKANGAATVDISGATFAAVTGADAWYDLTLTTSHTDTVGELLVIINDDSLILPLWQRFQVIEEAQYDAIFAASANAFTGAAGSTTLTALADGSITAAKIASDAITAAKIASDAITAAKLAADCITAAKIADGAIDAATLAADCITAAKIADDAIGADQLAATAVAEIWTTALTEAYNTDGAAPTAAQALFVIMQRLTEFAMSGTSLTVKKLNGSDTALVLTLDNAAAPTSSTRSS